MHRVKILLLSAIQIIPLSSQTGTIQGRITNRDGAAEAEVRVMAQPVPDSAEAPGPAVLSSLTRTDSEGRFRLENLTPGRYYVTAGLIDAPTYYPGVTAVENARVVYVTAANPAQEINFSLARPAALKVRGKVTYEPRVVPPPNLRVLMSGLGVQQTATPATDGTFEFTGMTPGNYRIALSPANGSTPQQLVLTDRDAQLELVMPFTVTVTGTLSVGSDVPQPRMPITFTEIANRSNRVIASGAQNGLYTVLLKPGTYEVTYGTPQGFTLASLVSGSTDLMNNPFVVMADRAQEFAARLTVSDPTAFVKVSGRVIGNRRPGLQIRLTPTGGSLGAAMQAPVAADGSFEFPKVLNGIYNAAFDTEQVTLSVAGRDLTYVEIVLPEVVEVSAHVQVEGGGPIPRLPFRVAGPANRVSAVRITTRGEGQLGLELPIGQSTLSVPTPPAGYVIRSMTYDSINLLTSPINVTASNRDKEIEVKLAFAPGIAPVKIIGRIVSGTSPFTFQVQISLLGQTNLRSAVTTTNGEFEVPQVLPGNYTLRAFATGQGINVSMPLIIGNTDAQVQVRMPPSLKDVSGRMVLDQGMNAGQPQFWLELTGVNAGESLTVYSTRRDDGSFKVRLPLGEWRVNVGGLPSALSLKSASYGDADLLRDSLKVDATDSQELRLTVVPKSGITFVRLRGRIVPPTDQSNLFRPVQFAMRLSGPMTVESRIQPDGTFEFPQLVSGTYSWCCNFAGYTSFTVPTTDADVTLRAVTGRVIGGEALLTPTFVQANDGAGTSAANVLSDNSFMLVLAEGSFRIGIDRIPAGFYLQSIRYGSTELTNQILVVPRGEDAKELIVTLAPKP